MKHFWALVFRRNESPGSCFHTRPLQTVLEGKKKSLHIRSVNVNSRRNWTNSFSLSTRRIGKRNWKELFDNSTLSTLTLSVEYVKAIPNTVIMCKVLKCSFICYSCKFFASIRSSYICWSIITQRPTVFILTVFGPFLEKCSQWVTGSHRTWKTSQDGWYNRERLIQKSLVCESDEKLIKNQERVLTAFFSER